ncbi:protein detoxification 16 [Nicotiana attenuata]|uniref:Protein DETOXIFICATION n=1 Tax=Nicotiana attenuata TaxID=49451 RepID=A0A314L9W2_NICAT|nr:protein detoxification 16 [Nicotiana attenuata]
MESQSSGLQTLLVSNQEIVQDFDKKEAQEQDYGTGKREIIEEAKKQLGLAVPLIAVNILQYCLQIISIMFVGHLGELALSGASMATSFASVTGFSVLLGMGSALETLCGQAYGAKQYHMLGIYTQRAMLVLLVLSILLLLIWFNTSVILIACGQDPDISAEAGQFNRWMIPGLFAYGILQCLDRFLQTQNIVMPMMLTSGFTALFHILICWIFVFKIGLGSKGAALANAISYWVNVFLLAGYIEFSPACRKTWTGFSKEALHDILDFLKLAIPSAIMICLNTCWMVYMVSVGLGAAISTRVSNELGAGRPQGARLALYVIVVVAISVGLIIATTTILVRFVWGKLYSNEEEVIRYVAKILPLLALSDFLDGFQCVLSGAARGCGWQKLCAFINLGAYYVVGLPSSVLFAFVFRTGGMGLWMGIICALLVQNVALIAINICTNWDKEARKAVNRVQVFGLVE